MFLSLCTCLCVRSTSWPLSDNVTMGISLFVDVLVCEFPPCSECLLSLCSGAARGTPPAVLFSERPEPATVPDPEPAHHQITAQKPSEPLCANNTAVIYMWKHWALSWVHWSLRTRGLNWLVWGCRSVTGRCLMEDEGCGATEKQPESYKDAEKRKNLYSCHCY